ncbi:VOC family protein [Muricoccus pecuniae]|uniref:TusA-related sulfurtransferase n=1 Tax=Muricoccus pecuniae TaxID=693023 RepID=A0A840XXD6_9PROT|nr:VOC family protein [Roseomonas pecuniae]MBB5692546.1 TusA-related sulfurtransferase [Roseomonas pecuniae]
MLLLDHLVVIAPSLAEGVAHVRDRLGLEMPFGGAHPEMGTHNHLLRLGDGAFLEVIAADPAAPAPAGPRWFGLDDAETLRADWEAGRRLRAWVARTEALPELLARHGDLLGTAASVSRGDRRWTFAVRPDGGLPAGGAAPCPIDWGPRGCPATAMPDLGARLATFTVEHPDPDAIGALHASLGLADPPRLRPGPALRLEAVIDTPSGPRVLS